MRQELRDRIQGMGVVPNPVLQKILIVPNFNCTLDTLDLQHPRLLQRQKGEGGHQEVGVLHEVVAIPHKKA